MSLKAVKTLAFREGGKFVILRGWLEKDMSKEKKTAISTITEICQTSFTLTPYSSQVNNPPRSMLGISIKRQTKRKAPRESCKAFTEIGGLMRNSLIRFKEVQTQAKNAKAIKVENRKNEIL